MTKWVRKVPSSNNPKYAFNKQQAKQTKYADVPYIPQLIGVSNKTITGVLQEELCRKNQIKTVLVINAIYVKYKYNGKGNSADKAIYEAKYLDRYHRGKIDVLLSEKDIDEHLAISISHIDKKISDYLIHKSGFILKRINSISIETYTLCHGTGGSFISTSKRLANIKSTINPDNKDLIDLETKKPSEKYLQDALGLGDESKYLHQCLGWNEKTATPKLVIASKNFKRKYKIRLLALTDIIKSEDKDKYRQKNHFLWIKNPSRLIYRDSAHKEKKHLCDGYFQSFPSE
ncbi:hypothetical protein GLOIN_2v1480811 [Rhizophagus irregularis DAOM 181602=DAOM 197198]|nr:hypothetical protein GLOIN_2v1480811 [Rhizophagus irregularis DAOM 181602=DAOM 197198]